MMRVFSSASWPEEERERDKGDRDDGTDGNINSIKSFLIFPTGSLFSRAF
jgi:hypothetical protein